MRTSACIAAAIAAFLLCACTELQVKRAGPGEIEGIAYTLPKKTFIVELAYTFKECKKEGTTVQLYVVKVPKVTPIIEPDENERFYIPYDSLRLWFKDTDFTIDSHDGQTLKSVSSELTDKTSEALASIVSSAVRLATVGTATTVKVGPAAKDAGARDPEPECNADIVKDAQRLNTLRGKEKPTETEKMEIAQIEARLTHRQVVHWSPTKANLAPGALTLTTRISPHELVGTNGRWIRTKEDPKEPSPMQSELELTFHGTVKADSGTVPSGFLVRQGPNATLRVCEGACPTPHVRDGAVHREETRVLYSGVQVMPQFGSYVGMPLENRWFDSHKITIHMSQEGAVTKMGFKSNAAGAAALKSLETNLETVLKAKEARDKAEADARTAQQSAKKDHADQVAKENNAIAECLKAQQAVREANGTVTGTCQ